MKLNAAYPLCSLLLLLFTQYVLNSAFQRTAGFNNFLMLPADVSLFILISYVAGNVEKRRR